MKFIDINLIDAVQALVAAQGDRPVSVRFGQKGSYTFFPCSNVPNWAQGDLPFEATHLALGSEAVKSGRDHPLVLDLCVEEPGGPGMPLYEGAVVSLYKGSEMVAFMSLIGLPCDEALELLRNTVASWGFQNAPRVLV